MSAKALHVNLLNPEERRSSAAVRARVLLPIVAGICLAFTLVWALWVGGTYTLLQIQISSLQSEIDGSSKQRIEIEAAKAKLRNVASEAEQFAYYLNGREKRAELFKLLAEAMPDGISLSALSIPQQPEQGLRPPLGSRAPVLQGPTQQVERVELRLTGTARREQDVFQLMKAIKGNAFTSLVEVVEKAADPAQESPRVLAFRQEAPTSSNGKRNVFFDLVYRLKAREFVKK